MASDFPDVVSETFDPYDETAPKKYEEWFEKFKAGMMEKHGLNCKAILAHKSEIWTDGKPLYMFTLEVQLVIDDLT